MSTEAPAKGKKKLIVIVAAAALVLVGGAAAAMALMKKGGDVDGDEAGPPPAVQAAAPGPSSAPPLFVPLEPFTVNLADRNADRYAQVGITLEIDGSATGDRIKSHMPAIRNNILLAIADRTAGDLLDREGKQTLAERVRRETARALGYEVDDEDDEDEEAAASTRKRKKKRRAAQVLPVRAVHFSNFIIQ